mmetsp:Transcript_9815/g.27463  ORF Transcript_9815/g.27463 Transcript_9815/m.27463 type:complete len:245 (-) Transcript_9815:425-1159(-)
MVTVKWSSSKCSRGPKPWQWPESGAECRSSSYISLKAAVGTASSEVPVSTAARQLPSSQKSMRSPSTRIPRIGTIQCPISGSCTGPQERSSVRCALVQPPSAISLSSKWVLARKTPKVCGMTLSRCLRESAMTSTKLKARVWDKPSRPRPRMPSKLKLLNGSSDSADAAMKRSVMQPRLLDDPTETRSLIPEAFKPSMQMTSSTNTPEISPVPKAMVRESRGFPGMVAWPLVLMSRPVVEPLRR